MVTYTRFQLETEGLEPAFQVLLRRAPIGQRVTYGTVASHLENKLGIPQVFPVHIGGVAGALMRRIWEVAPDAPPINMLVVNGDNWEPGEGSDGFLKDWFGLSAVQLSRQREAYVQQAINQVRSYRGWTNVYRKLFRRSLVPDPSLDTRDEFEADGQPDNPRYGSGGPESAEHKKLKAFVRDNPKSVGIKKAVSSARNEVRLLSGDLMDVELLVESTRWGVEVKSIRSGDADLERGVYQCVKYRAVMVAESGFDADEADCKTLLVTERELPSGLRALARRFGVKHVCVSVNR